MKNHIIISLLILSVGLSQQEYDYDDIMEVKGLWYLKFSDELVDGYVYLHYKERKILLGLMIKGLKEGKWTTWSSSGLKEFEGGFLNGKEIGLHIYYWTKGDNHKWFEYHYSNYLKNGKFKRYGPLGKLEEEGTYKDDKKVGIWKRYEFSYRINETTIITTNCDEEPCND